MELSEIEIKAGIANDVEATLRADVSGGDRGYWIIVGGWGGTEAVARAQIDTALRALDLDTDKIRNAI